jgi:hypothetical protein
MDENSCPRKIEVTGYSGYKANERPLHFSLDGRKRVVQNLIDRWFGPEHDYFKLLADDGKVYLLKYERFRDLWFLEKRMEKLGKH